MITTAEIGIKISPKIDTYGMDRYISSAPHIMEKAGLVYKINNEETIIEGNLKDLILLYSFIQHEIDCLGYKMELSKVSFKSTSRYRMIVCS